MQKFLFLDIDGVLNNDSTKVRIPGTLFQSVEPALVKLYLDWLKDRPDISVVLSSSWRTAAYARDELNSKGITWIATTPSLHTECRGDEVKAFLSPFTDYRYAILDDCYWFLPEQLSFFVETDYKTGLTSEDLKKVDQILGG